MREQNKSPFYIWFSFAILVWAASIVAAQTPASKGTILSYSFDDGALWPDRAVAQRGTIDNAGGKVGSAAMVAMADPANSKITIKSGPLTVSNSETNLGKLTLSFSLSVTSPRPIQVSVESYDAKKQPTGTLQGMVYPAAGDFYQRFTIDLSTMQAGNAGKFNPTDPFIGISFEAQNNPQSPWEMRLDNVHYTRPAFYVSPAGDDAHDGLSEQTAFAYPQKAVDAAQAGDVILLMDGTYSKPSDRPAKEPLVEFVRPGTPAAWITLKNYPGQKPVLSSGGQLAVRIERTAAPSTQPMAYVEVRGLNIRGNGDTAREKFPDELGKSTPNTDSMGIIVFGRAKMVHHIRLADNCVEFCTSDGIYIDSADWLYVEHNQVLNNCWTTVGYAPAGLALMKYANFDASENTHRILISSNRVSGNRLYVKNHPYGKEVKTGYFNGNGILIDANAEKPPAVNTGRTLVQNNLVFNNGAGGIQMWGNHRVDLVNNTVYCNGTLLNWGQMGFEMCNDVRLVNNIIVAQPNRPLDSWFAKPDRATTNITRDSNLYFGGVKPPVAGINVMTADPKFVHAGADRDTADFHLDPQSPAIAAGRWDSYVPIVDIEGHLRTRDHPATLGAFAER